MAGDLVLQAAFDHCLCLDSDNQAGRRGVCVGSRIHRLPQDLMNFRHSMLSLAVMSASVGAFTAVVGLTSSFLFQWTSMFVGAREAKGAGLFLLVSFIFALVGIVPYLARVKMLESPLTRIDTIFAAVLPLLSPIAFLRILHVTSERFYVIHLSPEFDSHVLLFTYLCTGVVVITCFVTFRRFAW